MSQMVLGLRSLKKLFLKSHIMKWQFICQQMGLLQVQDMQCVFLLYLPSQLLQLTIMHNNKHLRNNFLCTQS